VKRPINAPPIAGSGTAGGGGGGGGGGARTIENNLNRVGSGVAGAAATRENVSPSVILSCCAAVAMTT